MSMTGRESSSMGDGQNLSMGDGQNPSMGDGEMSKGDGEHHKKLNVKHFCRIRMVRNNVRKFSPWQIKLVQELGAGFVFTLGTKMDLDPSLTNFLVHHFRCDKDALEVEKDVLIEIRPLMKGLYNLSNTGEKLSHPGHAKHDARQYVKGTEFKYLINMSIFDLWNRVLGATEDVATEEEFCILFMLALLNSFLAPSRSTKVDISFLMDLNGKTVGQLKELDWCSFIADYLINSIRLYQDQKSNDVPGCIHLLHLIFVDYLKYGKARPTEFPRSMHVKDADLKDAAKKVPCGSLKDYCQNTKSADIVDVESMDSSPPVSRNKKARARRTATQKTSAAVQNAKVLDDVTQKIMKDIKDCLNVSTSETAYEGEEGHTDNQGCRSSPEKSETAAYKGEEGHTDNQGCRSSPEKEDKVEEDTADKASAPDKPDHQGAYEGEEGRTNVQGEKEDKEEEDSADKAIAPEKPDDQGDPLGGKNNIINRRPGSTRCVIDAGNICAGKRNRETKRERESDGTYEYNMKRLPPGTTPTPGVKKKQVSKGGRQKGKTGRGKK